MIDLALATMLSTGLGTGGSSPTRRHQRVIVSSIGELQTPLPEAMEPTSLRQFATRGVSMRRSVVTTLTKFGAHVEAAGVLRINAEDEAFVARLFSESVPPGKTKRVLSRRRSG